MNSVDYDVARRYWEQEINAYRRAGMRGHRPTLTWEDEAVEWVFTDPEEAAREMDVLRLDLKLMLVEMSS